jgi:hypothetical protein
MIGMELSQQKHADHKCCQVLLIFVTKVIRLFEFNHEALSA